MRCGPKKGQAARGTVRQFLRYSIPHISLLCPCFPLNIHTTDSAHCQDLSLAQREVGRENNLASQGGDLLL